MGAAYWLVAMGALGALPFSLVTMPKAKASKKPPAVTDSHKKEPSSASPSVASVPYVPPKQASLSKTGDVEFTDDGVHPPPLYPSFAVSHKVKAKASMIDGGQFKPPMGDLFKVLVFSTPSDIENDYAAYAYVAFGPAAHQTDSTDYTRGVALCNELRKVLGEAGAGERRRLLATVIPVEKQGDYGCTEAVKRRLDVARLMPKCVNLSNNRGPWIVVQADATLVGEDERVVLDLSALEVDAFKGAADRWSAFSEQTEPQLKSELFAALKRSLKEWINVGKLPDGIVRHECVTTKPK